MPIWGNPNEFSLAMRCTNVKYAKALISNGAVRFNTPDSWVKYAIAKGDGRGDRLEGTIAGCNVHNIGAFLDLRKKYSIYYDLFTTSVGTRVYFKRRRSMGLPCYCLYALKHSMFECPETEGVHDLETLIPPSYFRGFADNIRPEDARSLPVEEQPAVVFINNYSEFKSRLVDSLLSLGLKREQIIEIAIGYYNFDQFGSVDEWFDLNQKSPYELAIKHIKFSDQNEIRYILNTDDDKIKKYLANNALELGPLSGIADYKETYFYEGVLARLKAKIEDKP